MAAGRRRVAGVDGRPGSPAHSRHHFELRRIPRLHCPPLCPCHRRPHISRGRAPPQILFGLLAAASEGTGILAWAGLVELWSRRTRPAVAVQ